jgi:hypothetical protein
MLRQVTLVDTGAKAGSLVCGAKKHNEGLRVRLLETQAHGDGGPVIGRFVLIDAGDNGRSDLLRAFVGTTMNAEEILHIVRIGHPSCVNPVNANALMPEVE